MSLTGHAITSGKKVVSFLASGILREPGLIGLFHLFPCWAFFTGRFWIVLDKGSHNLYEWPFEVLDLIGISGI